MVTHYGEVLHEAHKDATAQAEETRRTRRQQRLPASAHDGPGAFPSASGRPGGREAAGRARSGCEEEATEAIAPSRRQRPGFHQELPLLPSAQLPSDLIRGFELRHSSLYLSLSLRAFAALPRRPFTSAAATASAIPSIPRSGPARWPREGRSGAGQTRARPWHRGASQRSPSPA